MRPIGTGSSTGPDRRRGTEDPWPGRALPGASGGARRPAGGGGRELRPPVRGSTGQATSSSVAAPAAAGPRPGHPSAPSAGSWPAPPARSGPVRDPGTRTSLPGTGRTCGSPRRRIRSAGPASPHTSAPPWRVRALHEGSRRWVEARTVVRRSRSAAGSAPSEGSQWRPRSACRCGRARGPSRRSRSPGEGGDRSRRARGGAEDGVQRLAAVVAQLHRSGAGCAYLGAAAGPYGNELQEEPGDLARRAGTGRSAGRTGQRVTACPDQAGRHDRTPGPAAASRWPGSVQAVRAVLRRGRPLLHGGPAASTAVRPTTPDRGEAAPQRGKSAAGWIVGVLGISRSTTGRSAPRWRAADGGGPPQARYSPSGPAPHSATRRTQAARPGRAAGGAAARGRADGRRTDGRAGARPGARPAGRRPRGRPAGSTARSRPGGGRGAGSRRAAARGARRGPARHGRGLHRAQRDRADGAACAHRPAGGGRTPARRARRARGPPSARSSTSIERGEAAAGLRGDRVGGHARRGRPLAAAHVASRKSCPRPGKVSRTRRKIGSAGAVRDRFLRHAPGGRVTEPLRSHLRSGR